MDDFPKLDECLLAWLGAGRWRVLGRKMKPLTLLHRELLRMAGSPLVNGEKLLLPDLDLVAQIGSRELPAAAAWLARPKRRWQGRWRMVWLLLAYGWRMQAQWRALREWVESCEHAPEMLVREAEGHGAGFRRDAPPLLELWTTVTAAGFSADAVLREWPAGLARWVFEVLRSREGGRKFETERDRELYEKARQMKAVTEPPLRPESEAREQAREMMRRMRGKLAVVDDG